jgi:anti-sigma regulatory factor (Ser/Thr protein kinase)
MAAPASLLIRNDPDELTRVGAWVNDWGAQHQIPDEVTQQVDLCAAEAVTNVLTHGFGESTDGRIALRIARDDDAVVFEIEDDGIAFDPTSAELPALATMDSERLGGWGMRIVRRFASELRYCRNDGRNCLTMVFRLRSSAAA